LESAHALAAGLQVAAKLKPTQSIIINLSGRGDKDVAHILEEFPDQIEEKSV
jgi:tryptophan synthase beta chain